MLGSRLAALVIAFALMLGPAGAVAEEGFFSTVNDLPLMPGLSEIEAATTVFDKPGGRIVEAYAEGRAQPQAIWRFYDRTLPQLGWQRRSRGRFVRDGELLSIQVTAAGQSRTVRFSIAPE